MLNYNWWISPQWLIFSKNTHNLYTLCPRSFRTFIKNLQSLPDHCEILSKWGPHEYLLLSKFRNDRVKIVDFLVKAYFWPSPETPGTQCSLWIPPSQELIRWCFIFQFAFQRQIFSTLQKKLHIYSGFDSFFREWRFLVEN